VTGGGEVRLAELLVGLSAVADLGMGQPVGGSARACLLAVMLAEEAGCDRTTAADVYYAALLQHVGCTAYSHEASALFADEILVKRASLETNFDRPREVVTYLAALASETPKGSRARAVGATVLRSRSVTEGYSRANCEVAAGVARRLGLGDGTQRALLDVFERWDGKGHPKRAARDAISPAIRVVHVATIAALFDRLLGPDAAVRAVRERAGRVLDPGVAATFGRTAGRLLGELDAPDAADASDVLVDAEPSPAQRMPAGDVDHVLGTFGDAVDLKSPFLHGHSAEVSRLAAGAAESMGLAENDVARVRSAGLVHDIGRTAVPGAIWERPGPLGSDAWMQVRLHPYHSEQVLMRSAPLRGIAALAGQHHERLDGTGYHRGSKAPAVPIPARVLAAADAFQAMTSLRPHRPARPPGLAATELRIAAREGRFDADAVEGVVAAASGATHRRRRSLPAGLTERQVDVLRLVADGLPNKSIAERLVISPRTAERHVQDVYAKIGVSSRAAAALFAMEHGLLPASAEDG
jgi:HD-GYP domain-containing protein (c-di-GMP phosphodiesterase class II)